MEYENLYVEIEGQETEDLYPELISLEVELDEKLTGMFRIRVPMSLMPDGSWTFLDDERFGAWKPVLIKAGFGGTVEELVSGYITHIRPCFHPDPSQSILEIWGMDKSVLMNRKEELIAWTNKTDSDIALAILGNYPFSAVIEDTGVSHEEDTSTIIQRETDLRFLRRLARRNDFECYMEGDTLYFGKVDADDVSQPVLACQFGGDTNVRCFSLNVDALKPANVTSFNADRKKKDTIESSVDSSLTEALGGTDSAGLLSGGIPPASVFAVATPVDEQQQSDTACQSVYHKARWFVTAEGQIAGNLYGHALKVRKNVTIKGVGDTYCGKYLVSHVTHTFTPEGYVQYFKLKRDAIRQIGNEDYSSGSSDGLV